MLRFLYKNMILLSEFIVFCSMCNMIIHFTTISFFYPAKGTLSRLQNLKQQPPKNCMMGLKKQQNGFKYISTTLEVQEMLVYQTFVNILLEKVTVKLFKTIQISLIFMLSIIQYAIFSLKFCMFNLSQFDKGQRNYVVLFLLCFFIL